MCSVCRHTHGHSDSVWLRVRRSHRVHVIGRHRSIHHPLYPYLRPCRSPRAPHPTELFLRRRSSEFLSFPEHHCSVQVIDIDSTTFSRMKSAADTSTIQRQVIDIDSTTFCHLMSPCTLLIVLQYAVMRSRDLSPFVRRKHADVMTNTIVLSKSSTPIPQHLVA